MARNHPSISFICKFLIFSPILFFTYTQVPVPVFADGLFQEQISASLGNRKADLLIKMNPPVVTTQTVTQGQKPRIEFRLFDSSSNQSIKHVTYLITIEKGDKSYSPTGSTTMLGI